MQTITDAITQLHQQGYNDDFTLKELREIDPEQFQNRFIVDQTYRFDELSDPEDQSVLYAVSSRDGKRRGLIINGYGAYADPLLYRLLEDTETKH